MAALATLGMDLESDVAALRGPGERWAVFILLLLDRAKRRSHGQWRGANGSSEQRAGFA